VCITSLIAIKDKYRAACDPAAHGSPVEP